MIKKIISITGKPGLYEILVHSPKALIVEDIITKKRTSVGNRERVVGLGDIAMYTESEDKPLDEILDLVYNMAEGKKINIKELENKELLKTYFGKILPTFDQERVRNSDIKKLFSWYNILIEAGFTKFAEEKDKEENAEALETGENKETEKK